MSVIRRTAWAWLLLLWTTCNDRGGPSPAASSAPPDAQAPDAAASARRPSRHYYLGRTQDRCEVFSVDGDQVSPSTETPCPPELLPGERIRLAGKTCIREGSDPDRREPV